MRGHNQRLREEHPRHPQASRRDLPDVRHFKQPAPGQLKTEPNYRRAPSLQAGPNPRERQGRRRNLRPDVTQETSELESASVTRMLVLGDGVCAPLGVLFLKLFEVWINFMGLPHCQDWGYSLRVADLSDGLLWGGQAVKVE